MKLFRSTTAARIAGNFWNLILGGARANPASKQCVNDVDEAINTPQELVDAVLKCREKSPASRRVQHPVEESVFIRMGDYWVIRKRSFFVTHYGECTTGVIQDRVVVGS